MKRRRRFSHRGVYFSEMAGVRAAVIDAGQLPCCLMVLLRDAGLLEARVRVPKVRSSDPDRTVSVREVLAGLDSAARVFQDCAAVVERVWQAQEQCSTMLDAGEVAGNELVASRWLFAYELAARIADDMSPVRRVALTAARAVVRRAGAREKARKG